MKADDRKRQPEAPAAPAPAGTVSLPLVPESGRNPASVAEGVSDFFSSIGATGFWRSKWFLGLLALVAVYAITTFLTSSSRQAASQLWTELERLPNADLEKFGLEHRGTVPGRIARLEDARQKFGPDGVLQFTSRDAEKRKKAVASVERARDEFAALADEFTSDLTLRAAALRGAAEAELSLVGVRKDGGGDEFRGSVSKAADYLKKLAQAAGEQTPVGSEALKRAEDLLKNEAQIRLVGLTLDGQLAPRPAGGLTAPAGLAPPAPPPASGPVAPPVPPVSPPAAPGGDKAGPAPATPAPPANRPADPNLAPLQPVPPVPATKK